MDRRTFVAGTGLTLAGAVAGCLGDPGDGRGSNDGNGNDDGNGSDDDDGGGAGNETDRGTDEDEGDEPSKPDDLRFTIDLEDDPLVDENEYAELAVSLVDPYVGADSPAEIEATLSNRAGEPIDVASGAPSPFGVVWLDAVDAGKGSDPEGAVTLWLDAYEESRYVGTDGKHVDGVDDIGLNQRLEAGESVTRTFELHAETPHLAAGTYEGEIGCGVVPAEGDGGDGDALGAALVVTVADEGPSGEESDGKTVTEKPRVDAPPYEIDRPEAPDDPAGDAEWNEHYLGENMPAEPSLPFERLEGVRLENRELSVHEEGGQYVVRTVESEAELEAEVNLEGSGDARDRLDRVDFEAELVVIVESGFGSGSVRHRWRRVEDVDDGVHLHGYYTQPYIRTDDYTSWASALVVERPDDLDLARVSLTVAEDRRVHFNSTEGPVSVDD